MGMDPIYGLCRRFNLTFHPNQGAVRNAFTWIAKTGFVSRTRRSPESASKFIAPLPNQSIRYPLNLISLEQSA